MYTAELCGIHYVMNSVGNSPINFGDTVRIRDTPETRAFQVAGTIGTVYGETTPSVTSVELIGTSTDDYAVNVKPENGDDFWIVVDLVEFIDHEPGTEIVIGNRKAMRRADGSWDESVVKSERPWWKIW